MFQTTNQDMIGKWFLGSLDVDTLKILIVCDIAVHATVE